MGRRIAWHAAAGLVVGTGCTLGTAVLGPDPAVSFALLVCSPILSAAVGAISGLPRTTSGSIGATVALCVFAGGLNAVCVYVVSQMLVGRPPLGELGIVLLFALPYGAIPGLMYAGPMCLGAAGARFALRQPRGSRGSLRGLVWAAGLAALGGAALARTADSYPLWPVLRVAGAGFAIACLLQAAVDLDLALLLRRAAGRDPRLRLREESDAPAEQVPAIAAGGAPEGRWLLHVVEPQGQGPYRETEALRPRWRLDRPPAALSRSLLAGAAGLYALAILLGIFVASAPPPQRAGLWTL